MHTSPEQIDSWRSSPEGRCLEFKEARNQFDFERLCRYCVALANEGGGVVVFGVADKPPRPVVGTEAFPNTQKTTEALFERLGFRVELEVVRHPAGRVVVAHVPSRPRGTAYHLGGAYLMRSGEELVPMSEDQLRRIFSEGQPEWLEEVAESGLTDQAVVERLDVQAFFELLGLPLPSTRKGLMDRLESERLISPTAGGWGIRRIGALILARDLNTFPSVSRKAVRVLAYNTASKLETRLDHTATRGYAAGFNALVEFIVSHVPQLERINGGLRHSDRLMPEVAVRELLANAIIHQDFNLTGTGVMVEIHPDRVEFSNPGEPIVAPDRFIDGYQSRNERLADLMRQCRICEERSSGIDRVVEAAESMQLPPPEFLAAHNRTVVVFHGRRPFDQMGRAEKQRACYQHCVLRWVNRMPMTNQTLRERFHLPETKRSAVSQLIQATIKTGLIKADPSGGGGNRPGYVPAWA